MVTAIADDADNPIGTETVIAPPTTPGPDGPVTWSNPRSVTWSPDGSTLFYIAWNNACTRRGEPKLRCPRRKLVRGVLAVPVDTTNAPFILADSSYDDPSYNAHLRGGLQAWGRQPLT